MKVSIFGASGKTGKLLVEQTLAKGYSVNAYVRRNDSISIQHQNFTKFVGELNNLEQLTEAIKGSDACISTLGGSSLMHHSPEIIDGIKNIIQVMETEGVKRFIYMSSIGAGESRYYMSPLIRFIIVNLILRVPLVDHNKNEEQITESNLEWTIIRPGGLTDESLNENYKHGSEKMLIKGSNSISRATVASFIASQLTDKQYIEKAVWLMP